MPAEPRWSRGQIVLEMYERLVEERTVEPTFYRDFPVEVSPLTRAHRTTRGWPSGGTWWRSAPRSAPATPSWLTRSRSGRGSPRSRCWPPGGDPEAMQLDEDFLQALEYGMPPTGGMGMGIDRMLIMFTGESIRETILFPLVRPE